MIQAMRRSTQGIRNGVLARRMGPTKNTWPRDIGFSPTRSGDETIQAARHRIECDAPHLIAGWGALVPLGADAARREEHGFHERVKPHVGAGAALYTEP